MKKLNKLYIGVLGMLLVFSACNKDLNLKPYQQLDQSQAILTAQDVQITLVGAYNRAGLSDLYGGGVFFYPDLMATQTTIDWHGTFQQLTQMTNQQIPNDNSFVNSLWLDAYEVINQANNVIANLDKVAAGDKERVEGEAKFLRGLTYFDLARIFGKTWNDGDPTVNPGVPIVTTPTTVISTSSYVARSSVSQVYQQAITDLTTAEAKLPADNSYSASSFSAAAILARLYLQKGDYANAATEATKVISSGNYSLNKTYAAEFPYPNQTAVHVDNTSEDVFAIQVTSQQGVNGLNTYFASSNDGGRGDVHVVPSFLSNFESGDARAGMFQYDDPTDPTSTLRCHKFDNVDGNVHIIRLAELYLIRAEANLRKGGTPTGDSPVNDIKVIRGRAGLTTPATVTVNDVLNERVRELAFEGGFFFHDAKRLGQTIGTLPFNSDKLVFPIPLQDINANPNLKQNPGY
ncbi:RagB/SusD family nutrient uptake outer membrane protein [Mucilaginibacter gotjawali]|uniref:Tetratricopeptide (TPR) repeat protein n=2 Tax=Mucilaginibacter gotjawali TaxID=1550579 RepID=A0A839SH77_9SPHI|nr:RagB/SusD family nutrient uptake outer membrane protein [Mucilaginibacter gotjawali]MBB3055877.1 tetratricopeptide (TPR) repeat protein [Mucilaginibacter gotjawali]BAU54699.1 SusD family protein [Mucilaginibacter gotjawali]